MGFEVPISMPRYTHIESTDTISTSPRRLATSSAASDFPDAVTPRRETIVKRWPAGFAPGVAAGR